MRVGIYPGTFDPVHQGHVAFARAAMLICHLDQVVFLPEAEPRGKQQVTELHHRLEMLKLAVADTAAFRILTAPDAQFTVEHTLPWLQSRFNGDALTLLVGSDVAAGLVQWPFVDVLTKNMNIAIGLRHTADRTEIEHAMESLRSTVGRVVYSIVTTSQAATSSSAIRRQFLMTKKMGQGDSQLAVLTYAKQYGLYTDLAIT